MTDPLARGEETLSILDALRRHRVAAVTVLTLVIFGVLAYRQLLKPPAIAESRVVVENPRLDSSGVGSGDPVAYFADQLALARLPVVTNQALAAVPTGGSLSDVRISADPASDTIVFTTTLPQGEEVGAVALTNTVVANYVALSQSARQRQATASLQAVDASLTALSRLGQSTSVTSLRTQLTTRQTALTEESQSPADHLTVSPAELQPSGVPGLTRLGLAGVLGGVLLALGIAVTRDGGRRKLTHPADATAATGLSVLAKLPLGRRRRVAAHATWTALIPAGGLLLVAIAADGLEGSLSGDDALSDLFGPAEPNILVVTLPVLRSDFEQETWADAPAVLVAGPLTTVEALREAQADLARARITTAGLVWSEKPGGAGRFLRRRASARQPVTGHTLLRRPPSVAR